VTYTQLLNSRGGIEADVTVTRVGPRSFWLVTGTAFGSRDGAWLRRQARAGGYDVDIADITGQYACFALWGPRSRELLQNLTATDMSHRAFGFMTSQEISIGDVPVRAQRVTFVGELGWELYTSAEYGLTLWETLWQAGSEHGLVAGGYRAIESLRLEKGYRVWGSDVTGETDPLSAGLDFCVAWDKPGGFLGRDALARIRDDGPERRLACMTLDDPRMVVLGGEPVRVGGTVVGRVTSGGFGYTVGASIAYGYLPVDRAAVGTEVAVDIFGQWVPGRVAADQLHDPRGLSIRA
jgi:4-methylaminobutanoate oxidase (formaldehyde-forming)